MLRIHTFGGCYVDRDGTRLETLSGQRKGLALLALLAAAGERGMSRSTVLAYLWPDSDEDRARTSLKQLVHSLRTQLSAPELLLPSADLRLNADLVQSDVGDFRDAVQRDDHESAAALYAGPFLDGFYLRGAGEFDPWVANERTDLARLAARSFAALAERATARGEHRAAVEWWRRLAQAEPLSARAATGLMLALDAAGERAAALQHARVYELLVREQVGGTPDPSVLAIVHRLQHSASAAAAPRIPLASRESAQPTSLAPEAGLRPKEESRSRSFASGLVAIGALILIAATAYRIWPRRETAGGTCASVAVLPFANTSGDAANEPFSDGLTDELIGTLGKIRGLKIAGRTSSFALKGKGLSVHAVADTLGVCAVLEGSVRREGHRLKTTAELVNTSNAAVIWTETYDRELVDAFSVQEDVARAIVAALRLKLAARSDSASVKRPTADPIALELYLKGRYIWWQRTNREGTLQAAQYFEQAIAQDPKYARAYAGLSDAHARLGVFGYGPPHEEFAKAKAAAQQALALDSTLADAHASLAHVLFLHDFDWANSEREFRIALSLDPSYTFARIALGICLSGQGRLAEGIAELDTAHASDPLSPAVPQVLGRLYVMQRRPDVAIRYLKEALELNPMLDLSYQQLGHAYLQKNMYSEALTALRRAAALSGGRDSAELAYAYAVAGQRAEAHVILASLLKQPMLHYTLPFHIAMAYAGLGDNDQAFQWLDRGYEARASFMSGVKVEVAFDRLHGDPRWPRLLERMGLRP